MSIPVHRDTDSRSCGATTTVAGQGNVYANFLLVISLNILSKSLADSSGPT